MTAWPTAIVRLTAQSKEPILVVDFFRPPPSRPLGNVLVEAVERTRRGHALYRLDVVGDLASCDTEEVPKLETLVAGYVEQIVRLDSPPVALVSDCAGAVLVDGLAAKLPTYGCHPATIRVAPARPSRLTLRMEFERLLHGLGAALEELPDVDFTSDPQAMLVTMVDRLRQVARQQTTSRPRQNPIQERIIEDLLARQRAWLSYLLTAESATMPVRRTGVDLEDTERPDLGDRILQAVGGTSDPCETSAR
ncbi:hypothetical protein [Tenggerimyces flavus]|uniref:STAS domain-containing protein n=1 Tax=Tenggerimyces flavus TaxID=1708749 RepID=A0ABV7YJP9_9ACTN|nr:hypothetical protein [Tenggerimyces flavus]MBM7789578.1 hypothetical protein [Tenggerimyces flavus]